jgi:hypothetical protein
MANPNPNWNYTKKDLPGSAAIPNGDVYVDVRLKTIDGNNRSGYLPLYPEAKTGEEGKNLEYAIQTNGKVTWRVVDDNGLVRRQFNNLQELSNSGFNFGFPANSNYINQIKGKLNNTLAKRTEDNIISQAGTSPTTGTSPEDFFVDVPKPLNLPTEKEVQEFQKNLYKYPIATIESSTDYLLISVKTYKQIGKSLIRNRGEFNSPQTKIATNSIILPIPSTIQDGNSVSYADGSLDGITAAVADYALNTVQVNIGNPSEAGKLTAKGTADLLGKIQGSGLKDIYLRELAARAANLPGVGQVTREQILARESGGILNPNMELFFNGVALRSFKFSFKLTPRSDDEAKEIKQIIRILKSNMAPKIVKEFQNNFLKTPNVFDLQYMQGSSPHPYLHRFKTCALTDMSVNYTGEGLYATYNDASPISMIMDLTFKELEPIYDTDYDGVGGVGY